MHSYIHSNTHTLLHDIRIHVVAKFMGGVIEKAMMLDVASTETIQLLLKANNPGEKYNHPTVPTVNDTRKRFKRNMSVAIRCPYDFDHKLGMPDYFPVDSGTE